MLMTTHLPALFSKYQQCANWWHGEFHSKLNEFLTLQTPTCLFYTFNFKLRSMSALTAEQQPLFKEPNLTSLKERCKIWCATFTNNAKKNTLLIIVEIWGLETLIWWTISNNTTFPINNMIWRRMVTKDSFICQFSSLGCFGHSFLLLNSDPKHKHIC